jgi:hypothetical protein
MSLASKLPWTHRFAGGFSGIGSQPLPTDADAIDYLTRVAAADGAGVETGVATAVDAFFRGVKADNTFSAIKAACLLCGARTLAGALVPLVGTAPTNNNFVDPDYNRETGLVGNGSTKYLDSNRAGNADGQDDHHLAVYKSSTGDTLGKWYAGTSDSSVPSFSLIGEDGAYARTNVSLGTFSNRASTGLFGISRQSGSSASYIRLGSVTSVAIASYAVTDTRNSLVFGRNDSAGFTGASNARLAFYSIGEALDLLLLDARVSALITAIGAAL